MQLPAYPAEGMTSVSCFERSLYDAEKPASRRLCPVIITPSLLKSPMVQSISLSGGSGTNLAGAESKVAKGGRLMENVQ